MYCTVIRDLSTLSNALTILSDNPFGKLFLHLDILCYIPKHTAALNMSAPHFGDLK